MVKKITFLCQLTILVESFIDIFDLKVHRQANSEELPFCGPRSLAKGLTISD